MRKLSLYICIFVCTSLQAQDRAVPILDFASLLDQLKLEDDSVHIVNFWATWCKPCVAELPHFEALHERYEDQPVKVTLVSLDFKNQIDSKLLPFLAEHNLQSEVVVLYERNPNDWIDKIDPSWSGAIPATLFVHQDGNKFVEGQFEHAHQIEEIINSFYKL